MTSTQRQQSTRDFSGQLREASGAAEPSERLARLAELAATPDLSYLQTIQVDRALASLRGAPESTQLRIRLAVLCSATVDHLLPFIRVAGLRKQFLIETHLGQFGQYRQELLGSSAALDAFRPTAVLLSLSATDLVGGVSVAATRSEADAAIRESVDGLRALWRAAKTRFGAIVIQQSFLDVEPPLFGNHERVIWGAPGRLVARLNDEVAAAAPEEGILLVDVAAACARDGLSAWFDERHWLQGKFQVAPAAAGKYAELLVRLLGAQYGRSKKCLVLDLDNTLWGGVLGDDGIEGVKLGQGSALGEAHLALQKYAKQLKERGVVLAVCSKNEWTAVETMFDRHPEMCLRRSDIAAFAVNWRDKAENIRALAEQLNLGLDSLVFVDDNPAERERVRDSLPMVAVPALPDDPALFVRALADGGFFEATVLTAEDRERGAQYAANAERDELRTASTTMEDFLRGLNMSAVYGPATGVDLARVTQLINKTNQFNTTTVRMTAEEVAAWTRRPENLALQFRLVDKFGDNGLVSVMLLSPDDADGDALHVANWVMSCRVFGRQLEYEAMNIAVEAARGNGVRRLRATLVPTSKNAVIKSLFADLGFQRADSTADTPASRWVLELTDYRPHGTYIARRKQGDD